MRRRHAAQETALRAVSVARGAVQKAQERRAAELARLDVSVGDAERGLDEAFAVLAGLVSPAEVADYAGESLARVREALKRASGEVVAERVAALTEGLSRRRGPGRPRGSRGAASAEAEPAQLADAPLGGVDLAVGSSRSVVTES
jgi:hypothetical protein